MRRFLAKHADATAGTPPCFDRLLGGQVLRQPGTFQRSRLPYPMA